MYDVIYSNKLLDPVMLGYLGTTLINYIDLFQDIDQLNFLTRADLSSYTQEEYRESFRGSVANFHGKQLSFVIWVGISAVIIGNAGGPPLTEINSNNMAFLLTAYVANIVIVDLIVPLFTSFL